MVRSKISGRIKVIEMAHGGPNAMDLEFLTILKEAFEPDDTFDGIVLMGNGRFFSAGLNIIKLITSNISDVKEVITSFSDLLLRVMTFPGPVIAVVNGHAVAGGCLLALSCDYRIGIRGDFKIGLNELALGLDLPPAALAAIRKTIPTPHRFPMVGLGRFYSPEEAFSVSIINELVVTDDADARAMKKARQLIFSLRPFQRLKKRLLAPELEKLETGENFVEEFAAQWLDPGTQEKIKAAVARLKKE